MHLTLHIQTCRVISIIMEIDKRELSYHNPTYITEGNSYFRKLKAEKMGRTAEGRESGGCLLVGSDCYRHRDTVNIPHKRPDCYSHHRGCISQAVAESAKRSGRIIKDS